MGRGSTSPTVTSSTIKEPRLPGYAKPYFEELLGRTAYEATRPYEAYGGQRLTDFDPYETTAMQGMAGMAAAGSPQQFLSASDIATNVGYQPGGQGTAIASQFQPQAIASRYQGPDIDPGYAAGDIGQGYQYGQRGVGYTGRGPEVGIPGFPEGGQFGPGFTPGTVADPETIQRYMSPYQQQVIDVEKREAKRQSDIMGGQMGQQAAGAGGLGGYREAIMQAERQRNLGQQLGDIQTRGSQAGFQQAQQAYEADRAARLASGQLGLQVGGAREQALQAGEQFGQAQFMTNEQLRQQQQQADLSVYQAGEAARQKAGAMGMTAQEIEDRGRQAADQARLGAERFNIETQRQRGELGLRGVAADQAGTRQRLDAARMLGGFGGQQQTMDYERLKNLQAAGQIRRNLGQQGMTMGYQDWQRQQAFPREQLGLFSQMLQGLPVTPGAQYTTYGGPSQYQNLLSTGIGGVGLYNAMNRPV